MSDSVKSYTNTADANAALPARAKIHKIVLIHADGTATMSLDVHDAATVTGTAVASLKTNLRDGTTYEMVAQSDFNPPLRLDVGGSFNITGTGTYKVYWTRD